MRKDLWHCRSPKTNRQSIESNAANVMSRMHMAKSLWRVIATVRIGADDVSATWQTRYYMEGKERDNMRALTIYQPWASLIAAGVKQYETRNWATKHRGPIAIHAGLKKYNDYGFLGDEVINKMEAALIASGKSYLIFDLPFGAVIATAELVGCWEIAEDPEGPFLCVEWDGKNGDHELIVKGDELLFGDWTPGRYAFELLNVKLLSTPVYCRGKQGIWNIGEDLYEQVKRYDG